MPTGDGTILSAQKLKDNLQADFEEPNACGVVKSLACDTLALFNWANCEITAILDRIKTLEQ